MRQHEGPSRDARPVDCHHLVGVHQAASRPSAFSTVAEGEGAGKEKKETFAVKTEKNRFRSEPHRRGAGVNELGFSIKKDKKRYSMMEKNIRENSTKITSKPPFKPNFFFFFLFRISSHMAHHGGLKLLFVC